MTARASIRAHSNLKAALSIPYRRESVQPNRSYVRSLCVHGAKSDCFYSRRASPRTPRRSRRCSRAEDFAAAFGKQVCLQKKKTKRAFPPHSDIRFQARRYLHATAKIVRKKIHTHAKARAQTAKGFRLARAHLVFYRKRTPRRLRTVRRRVRDRRPTPCRPALRFYDNTDSPKRSAMRLPEKTAQAVRTAIQTRCRG